MASILAAVGITVAYERALPVVVDVGVRDSNPVRCMGDVNEAIIIVLVMVQVAGEVAVVNPDILRSLDGDGVTIIGEDLGDLHVADNDVGLLVDSETDAR
jgi:hypothetical protein